MTHVGGGQPAISKTTDLVPPSSLAVVSCDPNNGAANKVEKSRGKTKTIRKRSGHGKDEGAEDAQGHGSGQAIGSDRHKSKTGIGTE